MRRTTRLLIPASLFLALGVIALHGQTSLLKKYDRYLQDFSNMQEITSVEADTINGRLEWLQPSDPIRSWGCGRRETPLIFVHIGKSGGGMVRARFAASAINLTKTKWNKRDDSFYPVDIEKKAYFCSSGHLNAWPNATIKTYEGTMECHATTPIGQAVACPEPFRGTCRGCDLASDECHSVYVGHNIIGNEMHWLPERYLSAWWASTWKDGDALDVGIDDPIQKHLRTLQPGNRRWCSYQNEARPSTSQAYYSLYKECSVPLQKVSDIYALEAAMNWSNGLEQIGSINWSPIYASLPLLRTTLMREPFSYLVSKFFWHENHRLNISCHDVVTATRHSATSNPVTWLDKSAGPGWAHRYAMQHIIYLCGEDCRARYAMGLANLRQLEDQAESNLRQSFAVVGLLNETDTFYDMVTARVGYVNMTLNEHIHGGAHKSGGGAEKQECNGSFQDPSFQGRVLEASPAIAALVRLYAVAVEVNRFQVRELSECDPFLRDSLSTSSAL